MNFDSMVFRASEEAEYDIEDIETQNQVGCFEHMCTDKIQMKQLLVRVTGRLSNRQDLSDQIVI